MRTPHLVLLPGLDGTGLLFGPLLAALPPEVPSVVVSYPGDRPLGYRELLSLVMASLPTSSPFVILGESFSGPLALMAAARRPAGLSGVILCGSFYRSPHPYVPAWLGSLIRPTAVRLFPRFAGLKALLRGYSPELRGLVAQAQARVSPGVLACRLREVLRVNAVRELETCPVPLLYLQGRHDIVVPAWNAAAIRRRVPSATIQAIAAPHLILQVQPQQAAAAIVAFLATLGNQ